MDQNKQRYVKGMLFLPGITQEIAESLIEAGLTTVPQVLAASDAELQAVKGVTKAKVTALKAFKAKSAGFKGHKGTKK